MDDYNEAVRQEILRTRFGIWKNLLDGLPGSAEAEHTVVRFPNSSTYLFSTGSDTFWMMDPAFSRPNDSEEELKQIAGLIREKISFIILTHLHPDHCQFELVQLLADSPIQWVVPEVCKEQFLARSGIPRKNLIVLAQEESSELSAIHITARRGYHKDPVRQKEVPSVSYEMTLPDGVRLFFPADVRDYRIPLPDHDPVDYTFGHVFLGREDATGNEFSLLDDFCRFMTEKKTANLILAHLYEVGRQPKDLWTCRHGIMIRERLKEFSPATCVLIPRFGDSLLLCRPTGSSGPRR